MIFICDDDPTYTLVLKRVLSIALEEAEIRDEIKSFLRCSDMVNELHSMNSKGLKPDVVFMDMRMPNVNGAECIKLLNEVYHQPIAIIAMSAEIDIQVLTEINKYIKAPLSKMTTPEDMILDVKAIVRIHLGRNRPRFVL